MNMSGYRADVCYARGSMWDSRTRPIVEISEIHGCWGHMAEVSCWGQKRVFRVLRATVRASYKADGLPSLVKHGTAGSGDVPETCDSLPTCMGWLARPAARGVLGRL